QPGDRMVVLHPPDAVRGDLAEDGPSSLVEHDPPGGMGGGGADPGQSGQNDQEGRTVRENGTGGRLSRRRQAPLPPGADGPATAPAPFLAHPTKAFSVS